MMAVSSNQYMDAALQVHEIYRRKALAMKSLSTFLMNEWRYFYAAAACFWRLELSNNDWGRVLHACI